MTAAVTSARPGPASLPLALAGVLAITACAVTWVVRAPGASGPAQQRRQELTELIRLRSADVSEQVELAGGLRDRLAAQGLRTTTDDDLAVLAGARPMEGAGLVVVLDDAEDIPADPVEAAAHRIVDRDVVEVVNALWSSGARAIEVNGQRLVATSPIRSAGGVVTVNFRPLRPPYEVRAVGGSRSVVEQSEAWSQLERWEDLFGLRVTIRSDDDVVVAAYDGRLRTDRARPVEEE